MPGRVAFRLVASGLLAAAALTLLPPAFGRTSAPPCGRYGFTDTSTHWEAVFGLRTSIAEANVLRRQLEAKAIKGIQLEREYCDAIELQIPGVDSPADRTAFSAEMRTSGVAVAFEEPDSQKRNAPGEVSAVFGHRPTLKRASELLLDVSSKGWREVDVVRVSLRDWKVVLRHVPQAGQADFAAEARGGGYRVTFEG